MHGNRWQRIHVSSFWSPLPPPPSQMAICNSVLEGCTQQGCLAVDHASHLQGCPYKQATSLTVVLATAGA